MRALLFLGLIIAIFLLIRFTLNRINQLRTEQAENLENNDQAEKMVTCQHCGLHLPQSEAIEVATEQGKLSFCSQAHLEAFIEDKQKS